MKSAKIKISLHRDGIVEGKTLSSLRDKLIEELLSIVAQVAEALGRAINRASFTRRKPDNVMVRPDGYAKVLDFGLVN
jgi:hypothetical protein